MRLTFDTSEVPLNKGFETWRNFASELFLPLGIERTAEFDTPFNIRAETLLLNQVIFLNWKYHSPSHGEHFTFVRDKQHISTDPDDFYLIGYSANKPVTIRQGNKERTSRPGDLTLLDTARPHELLNKSNGSGFTLYVPRALLQDRLAIAETKGPRIVPGNLGIAHLLTTFCTALPTALQQPVSPAQLQVISEQILSLITMAFQPSPEGTEIARPGITDIRYEAILRCIDENLHKTDISPQWVAVQLHISRRYLTQLLTQHETSFQEQLRNRRLARVATVLSSPAMKHLTVFEIAHHYGFRNASHFSRCFSQYYGMSPQEFRATASLNPGGLDQ